MAFGTSVLAEEIAGGQAILSLRHRICPQGLGAAVMGRAALAIDDGDLAVVGILAGRQHRLQGLGRRFAAGQEVEDLGSDGGVGDVLGGDRTGTGPRPGTAAGDADAGGGDGNPQHAGLGAAADEGEGHLRFPFPPRPDFTLALAFVLAMRSSGITAQTSISITHSGRARPWTMSPVETGKTPFSHFPTTR